MDINSITFGNKGCFFQNIFIFLEKKFLLREDGESKVELSEVLDALTDASHLIELEVVIHEDELVVGPSKA